MVLLASSSKMLEWNLFLLCCGSSNYQKVVKTRSFNTVPHIEDMHRAKRNLSLFSCFLYIQCFSPKRSVSLMSDKIVECISFFIKHLKSSVFDFLKSCIVILQSSSSLPFKAHCYTSLHITTTKCQSTK